jgi:hypothetical protein
VKGEFFVAYDIPDRRADHHRRRASRCWP